MNKAKKSLDPEIIENSLQYLGMTIFALLGTSFLLVIGLIFAGFFPNALANMGFTKPFYLGALVFFVISSATLFMAFKNGQVIFFQLQRKLAIEAEKKRIRHLRRENFNEDITIPK